MFYRKNVSLLLNFGVKSLAKITALVKCVPNTMSVDTYFPQFVVFPLPFSILEASLLVSNQDNPNTLMCVIVP